MRFVVDARVSSLPPPGHKSNFTPSPLSVYFSKKFPQLSQPQIASLSTDLKIRIERKGRKERLLRAFLRISSLTIYSPSLSTVVSLSLNERLDCITVELKLGSDSLISC